MTDLLAIILMASMVVVTLITTTGVVLVLRQWSIDAEAQRDLVRSSMVFMKSSSTAEAVAAEIDLRPNVVDEDGPEPVSEPAKPEKYTDQTGIEYVSSWEGGSEYWIDPLTNEKYEVSE